MSARPADIEEYLASAPSEARDFVGRLRTNVTAVTPDAVESISYGLPTFKYRGRPLVYFGAWDEHFALYALDPTGHERELADFDVSGGTLRFSPDRPPPDTLVRALLAERKAAIETEAANRRRGPSRRRTSR
jgi:uncharacterized protein YdhG (YjbR/CyaY superfamily)